MFFATQKGDQTSRSPRVPHKTPTRLPYGSEDVNQSFSKFPVHSKVIGKEQEIFVFRVTDLTTDRHNSQQIFFLTFCVTSFKSFFVNVLRHRQLGFSVKGTIVTERRITSGFVHVPLSDPIPFFYNVEDPSTILSKP